MSVEETRTQDIKFPQQWMEAVYLEMERVFNMPGRETRDALQSYLQEQYDALENKEGNVNIDAPTISQLKEYILKRKGM